MHIYISIELLQGSSSWSTKLPNEVHPLNLTKTISQISPIQSVQMEWYNRKR